MQPSSKHALVPANLTLVEQVQARREQLERALTADTTSKSTREDIEGALAAIAPMLTGDLERLPDMVSRDLTRWLESSKYIGVVAATAAPAAATTESTPAKVDDSERPAAAGAPRAATTTVAQA